MRGFIGSLLIMLSAAAASGADPPPGCAITFTKAHVFNGTGFEVRDLSLRDGHFVSDQRKSSSINAAGLWLIPPFVDAHTHSIDTPKTANIDNHRRWLSEGVFYALNPNNVRVPGPTPAASDELVEFEAAGGGLTKPGGHPTETYRAGMNGRAYHEVSDPAAARAAVASVKANSAAFVKLYLLNHSDPGGGDGLSAASFLAAVDEARRLGLRPIVHIEDADDFRLAVAARVFAIMHLPYWPPSVDPKRSADKLMIAEADAIAAARAGIIVVPTVILSLGQFDGATLAGILAVDRHNLTLLRDAGVRLAVGEDFIGDMHDEIAALRSFGLFDGAAMLRMSTSNGAALAFPNRRLGTIADGYEASFLIYRRDPTHDWIAARKPVAGMRAGHILLDDGNLLQSACAARQ